MKKLSLFLATFLVATSALAQNKVYEEAMLQTLAQMDQFADNDNYLDCANTFERIAAAEKTEWLPYYYSSMCCILISFNEADGARKDLILDRAQEMLDLAFALSPDEPELHVLQAFLYPARIIVDPMARGMIYIEKSFESLEKATALDPDNPRAYYLQGIYKLNLPPTMGGGQEAAKAYFEQAEEKFSSFRPSGPLWPSWGEDELRTELSRLEQNETN